MNAHLSSTVERSGDTCRDIKETHLDMSGTQRLHIERHLNILSRGSIWIHVCCFGDVPEGSSIYVVENAHVREQVGVIARYEPTPDMRSGMFIPTSLNSARACFVGGTIYTTAVWFCPDRKKVKKGMGQPASQPQ